MSRTRLPTETQPPPADPSREARPPRAGHDGAAGGPDSPRAQARAFLDIRLGSGRPTRRLLDESPIVLGRIPEAGLVLDHHTVSRRHAEMICDLYGRWWIRDLGSTNGTTIDGRLVPEHLLTPGDVIGVGDYNLSFAVEAPVEERESYDVGSDADDQPTLIRKLEDLEPPRISARHLRTLLELSRRLIALGDPIERRDALCALVVRDDFHAFDALVLRVESRRTYRAISRVHRSGDEAAASGHAHGGTPGGAPGGAVDLAAAPAFGGPASLRGKGAGGRKPYISRSLLDALIEVREPIVARSGVSVGGRGLEMSVSRDASEAWVLAVPLRTSADAVDVLYATVPEDFATAEWLKLYELAGEVYKQGETVWAARRHAQENAAIEHELDTARQIQRGLVPGPFSVAGLDVAVGFEPCRWVGGDYVDVVPLPDGRVLCAIADVCGKGLHAAMVSSSLHTMVRASADANPPLPRLIERVNRHLCEWLPDHSFVTMVAVAVDPVKGEIDVVNAGHPPPFVVSPGGRLTELQAAENPALGMGPVPMIAQRARLQPGDVLALYTDGLTELTDPEGEMLGGHRLGEALSAICADRTRDVAAMCAALTARLDAFRRGELPRDDCTFLLAQRR
jgi:sigma-B regulation protein RsbU (phosphoserine phosphatase)